MSTKRTILEIFIDSYHYRAGNHSFQTNSPIHGRSAGSLDYLYPGEKADDVSFRQAENEAQHSCHPHYSRGHSLLLVPLGLVVWLAVVNLQTSIWTRKPL